MEGFRIGLMGRIQNINGNTGNSSGIAPMSTIKTPFTDEVPENNFKTVMGGLANNLNREMNAPDQLLKEQMMGNTDVDIHDVMTAMAKAEMSVSVATQITSKVIQAYDKIMQISV